MAMLAIGCGLWYVATGKQSLGMFAWAFPFFILHFLHSVSKTRGFLLLFLFNYVAQALAWEGMVPVPRNRLLFDIGSNGLDLQSAVPHR